jgi:methionyl-tRNA formyltransferase
VTAARAGDSRVRTVFLGSGGFGQESLRRLHDHPDARLVGVVTAPPRSAGRGQRPAGTIIGDLAEEFGIFSILTPERLRDPEAITAILGLEPELLVLADYGQIVPTDLLDLRYGALNLHPSLLPRHRGATPVAAAILAGDTETGVTLMQMDAGLDTGPIVAQERVPLDGTETAPRLEEALGTVAAEMLERNVGPWIRGELAARRQPSAGETLTRPFRREDGRLDPRRSAKDLERQVRAYQPWPGSFMDTDHGRLVVWAAGVGPQTGRPPGTFGPGGLSTADGELLLHEVQPAGGKHMPWDAFVRGRPGIIGSAALASDA